MDVKQFENRIKDINIKLIQLKMLKINVYEYQKELDSIKRNLKSFQSNVEHDSVDEKLCNRLTILENTINKTDLIISFYKYCKSIESNVLEMSKKHKGEIDIDELNDYISKIKDYLINLKNDKNNILSNNYTIYTTIFEVIYALIDAEILVTNRSTLYDFIKSKNIDTRFINSILCGEINEINESKNDNQDDLKTTLNNIITKTNNTGSNNNYFNLEIIKLLLMFKSDYNVYYELEKEFKEDFKNYSKNVDSSISSKVDEYVDSLPELKQEKKESKIALIKRSIISALAACLVITGACGIERGTRKITTNNVFIKTTEVTSPLNEEPITEKEEVEFSKYPNTTRPSEQYIRVVSPWKYGDNNISRTVQKYDTTFLNLPDLSNLDNIDLDSLDITPDVYYENVDLSKADSISKYNNNTRELVNIDWEYKGKKLETIYYISILLFSLSIYSCLVCLLEVFIHKDYIHVRLAEIIDEIKYYLENIDDVENHLNEFKNLVDKLFAELSSNKELLEEFNKIYQENINLISDEDALKTEIDKMINTLTNDNNNMKMTLEKAGEIGGKYVKHC